MGVYKIWPRNGTQKVPYYRKKAPAYRGKSGQNTGTDFLALGLGVVLSLSFTKCACKRPREKQNSQAIFVCNCPKNLFGLLFTFYLARRK